MAKNLLTYDFAEPLSEASCARIELQVGDGNLAVDRLPAEEGLLASGALQYFEKQGAPRRSLAVSDGQASLTLRAGRAAQPWLHLPWAACNGATEWQVHLNPALPCEIIAHSDGGNLRLDLAEAAVTYLSADTGGGNIDLVLPERSAGLEADARTGGGNVEIELGADVTGQNTITAGSGAGNVVVRIPGNLAARIHATTGWGKALISPRFSQVETHIFQSADYDQAASRVDIDIKSGAGNVSVENKEN